MYPVRVPCKQVGMCMDKLNLKIHIKMLAVIFFFLVDFCPLNFSELPHFLQCTCITLIIREKLLVSFLGKKNFKKAAKGQQTVLPSHLSAPNTAS